VFSAAQTAVQLPLVWLARFNSIMHVSNLADVKLVPNTILMHPEYHAGYL